MERLPAEGYGELATKQDLALVEERLRGEIHKVARQQTIVYTTIMAVLNGVVMTALSLALT